MVRLFKRLAIVAGLWLGVSVAGVVYINARTPERRSADVEAAFAPAMEVATALDSMLIGLAGPAPEPVPPDDVMRAETETTIAEVEALYDKLIATYKALQNAAVDHWSRSEAADYEFAARMDKERAIRGGARREPCALLLPAASPPPGGTPGVADLPRVPRPAA